MRTATLAILIYLSIHCAYAWDTEELEIFDLVEEINLNFYNVLGVQQDASLTEIKRAFRNLSVILHPDKSDAEDANIQFRNLVSVYEVLKDASKREKYNEVLKNGLPNWKSALYYYRRVRKMGLAEMSFIVFMIVTIGQYIVAWAAYAEKKYTAETMLGSRLKKLQKKNKTNVELDTILNEIPVPSMFNTLPFQIPKLIWNIPGAIKGMFQSYSEYKQEQEQICLEEEKEVERIRLLDEAFLKEKEQKKEGIRKRKEKFAAKEKTDAELQGYSKLNPGKGTGSGVTAVNTKEIFSGGFWTDEDLTELVRLVKKYPGGTPARWEVIAEMMNRSVQEITFMAAKMKENGYRVPGQTDSVAESIVQEASKKLKVKRPNNPIIVPETTPFYWLMLSTEKVNTRKENVALIQLLVKFKCIGFLHIGSFTTEGQQERSQRKTKRFDENDYFVSINAASWQTANQDCSILLGPNASLVAIETVAEWEFLRVTLENYGFATTFWSSGKYDVERSEWIWSKNDQSIFSYPPWGDGHPGTPESNNRILIYHTNRYDSAWRSVDNTQMHRYICEAYYV